jgi:hypothetical protein
LIAFFADIQFVLDRAVRVLFVVPQSCMIAIDSRRICSPRRQHYAAGMVFRRVLTTPFDA